MYVPYSELGSFEGLGARVSINELALYTNAIVVCSVGLDGWRPLLLAFINRTVLLCLVRQSAIYCTLECAEAPTSEVAKSSGLTSALVASQRYAVSQLITLSQALLVPNDMEF
jgi:hypothetical protein